MDPVIENVINDYDYHIVLNKNDYIDFLEHACNWLEIDKGKQG